MKVRIDSPTDLRLGSGRRFTCKEPGEFDLDEMGLNRADQSELIDRHWITKVGGKLPPADSKPDADTAGSEANAAGQSKGAGDDGPKGAGDDGPKGGNSEGPAAGAAEGEEKSR